MDNVTPSSGLVMRQGPLARRITKPELSVKLIVINAKGLAEQLLSEAFCVGGAGYCAFCIASS